MDKETTGEQVKDSRRITPRHPGSSHGFFSLLEQLVMFEPDGIGNASRHPVLDALRTSGLRVESQFSAKLCRSAQFQNDVSICHAG